MWLDGLYRFCCIVILAYFSTFQTSYAESSPDEIKRIIVYASNPSIMTPVDDSRITFFDSWVFDGMHFKSITDPDSIDVFMNMIQNLEPSDTLSYNTYSNGTVLKENRKGTTLFLSPSRPGPIGAVIIQFFGEKIDELIWITPISLDRGFISYKVPIQLLKTLIEIGCTPNEYIHIFKDIYRLPDSTT